MPSLTHHLATPASWLNLRGWVMLGFAAFLLYFPLRSEHDFVAGTLGFSLFILVTISVLLVRLSGFVLKKTLKPSLSLPDTSEKLFSNTTIALTLRTSAFRVWPFTLFDIELLWSEPGVESPVLRVSGSAKNERALLIPVSFPHRGTWSIKEIHYRLQDRFGIAKFRWVTKQEIDSITIFPPEALDISLPPRSSADRQGDLVESFHHRQGDPFDIKQYHPSDGMRKILWKIFAKSGELLSRHPEPSMTPDGQVVMYVLASPNEDQVASLSLTYTERLAEANVDIFYAAEGYGSRAPARNRHQAEKLLIDAVWESTTANKIDEVFSLTKLYEESYPGSITKRVILFAGKGRLSTPGGLSEILKLGESLSSHGLEPVIALAETGSLLTGKKKLSPMAFLFETSSKEYTQITPDISPLLQACLTRRWEVLMEGEQAV